MVEPHLACRELAGRNPMLLFRLAGWFLLRFAARVLPAVLFQEPPRFTRLSARAPRARVAP